MRNIELLGNSEGLLAQKIEHLRDLKRDIDAISNEYNELKSEVVGLMGDATEAFNEQNRRIATLTTEPNNGFDKKSFEVLYPGVYATFTVYGTKKVFRFK